MMMYVLPVYIALLLVGGLIGFLKAGSRVSLVTSIGFAAALGVCGYAGVPRGETLVMVLQGFLLVVFIARFARTKKFMPAGLMIVVTLLALTLELLDVYAGTPDPSLDPLAEPPAAAAPGGE